MLRHHLRHVVRQTLACSLLLGSLMAAAEPTPGQTPQPSGIAAQIHAGKGWGYMGLPRIGE